MVALGAVGVGGIVVATVFALKVSDDQGPLDQTRFAILQKAGATAGGCSPPAAGIANLCNTLSSQQSQVDTDNTLMIVGAVAGGVALAGAIVYYFYGPGKAKADTAPAASVTPWLGAGTARLGLSGRF
jgi:hypothetical protein